MKRLRIYGLWFFLQIVSTMEKDPRSRNISALEQATSEMMLSPTATVLKSSDRQTVSEWFGSYDSFVGRRSTSTLISFKSSDFSKIHTINVFSEMRTRTQSVRNSYNNTHSSSVRNLYNDTQSSSARNLYNISATESVFIVRSSQIYVQNTSREIHKYNSSTIGVQTTTAMVTDSLVFVQYTTKVAETYSSVKISSIHARKTFVDKEASSSRIGRFQSRISEAPSTRAASSPGIVESQIQLTISSFTRIFHWLESSSEHRFLSTIQTLQTSRLINASRPTISVTEKLNFNTSSVSERSTQAKNGIISTNTLQSSTSKKLNTSKSLNRFKVTSSHRGPHSSRHGNSSYLLTNSEYLSSTRNANTSIEPTRVVTILPNTLQTAANMESLSIQSQNTSSSNSFHSSLREKVISVSHSTASELSSFMRINQSSYFAGKKSSKKITANESKKTSMTTLMTMISPTHPILTNEKNTSTGMPLYILAICLPLAALLGFVLAFAYFRRNQEDHRVRYSVTVEISAEKPDYEMKRMYSIVDVSSGINKDFLSGLESRKSSSDILDQLDDVSVSFTDA